MRELLKAVARSATLIAAVLATTATTAASYNPTVSQTGVMATAVLAGLPDSAGKVPALNAVPGAAVPTLSVALPQVILQQGTIYTYMVVSQNTTYAGTCRASYSLTQGSGASKVVLDSHLIKSFTCNPGEIWAWARNGIVIPNSPGVATLTGTIVFGTSRVSTRTTVLIQ